MDKREAELQHQYLREQEDLNNLCVKAVHGTYDNLLLCRALLGDEKARVGLSFMYDARFVPGMRRDRAKEVAVATRPETKFKWQRKYNAPREE